MFTVATRHVTDIMEVVKLIVRMEKVVPTVKYVQCNYGNQIIKSCLYNLSILFRGLLHPSINVFYDLCRGYVSFK